MCEITVVKGEIFSSENKIQNNCKQTIFQFMTRSFGEDKANITLSQKVTKQNKKKKKLCKKLKNKAQH